MSPAARPAEDSSFFVRGKHPEDVFVVEDAERVVGYIALGPATELPSNSHVLYVRGLAVLESHRRRGIGRALLAAAIEEARSRGARRLTLRVMSGNAPARSLYESMNFEIEGILREEFLIAGDYVDDVIMTLRL